MASSLADPQQHKQRVQTVAAALRDHVAPLPSVGLIVEGDAALDVFAPEATCDAAALPHGPDAGRWATGPFGSSRAVVLTGGPTLHDGRTAQEVAFPARVLGAAGVDVLMLLGAAAPVRPTLAPGDCMLVSDHINFQGTNPLVGPNVDDWGPRFPDMSTPYDPALRSEAQSAARATGVSLANGVYWGSIGPTSQTDAEDHMVRALGADAVGHAGIAEVIAARHMGLRVLSVAVMTGGDVREGWADAEHLLAMVADTVQQPAEAA
jgi:purine-nucleoside phosphorylase